ncbi:MAG: hypothetical protein COS84_05550 [Armatimonadetes bacterium CG07_land_8_20_14_0_80_40_9]|nr:MAG: hypothetical protein COS84_05550 [Armatimonadetes bacterium CG07_land_8_20_14_0_80_40_9]
MNLGKVIQTILSEPDYVFQQLFPLTLHGINKSISNLSRGYSLPPKRLLIALTTKCNLRCPMCVLWGEMGLEKSESPPQFMKEELNPAEIKRLIAQVSLYKPSIILTGGEPLLYKGWEEVAGYIRSKNLRLFMASGGMLIEENAEELVKTIDHLQISLDGPEKRVHDESRGVKGSFEKVISGIKAIAQIKKKRGERRPFINVCYTISKVNYKYLNKTVNFLQSLKVEINELAFQHLEFTDKKSLEKHQKIYQEEFGIETNFWSGFLYQPEGIDVNYLREEIKKVKERGQPGIKDIVFRPNLNLSEIDDYYTTDKLLPRYFRKCLAPWQEAFILPNGDVWTCADYIVGNIKKTTFKSIWNNQKSRNLRKTLNKIKVFPICKTCASLYVY